MNQVFPWREAPAAEFAVIGDPVSHSLSPRMHQAAYAALGLRYRYVAVHVPAGEVGPALDHLSALSYVGVNVTVPHKEDALKWCTQIDPLARRVQAANTLRLADKACINTDAPGFMETLESLRREAGSAVLSTINHQASTIKPTVLLLGAGGSARALAFALAQAGWRLRIYNRTRERAVEMLNGLEIEAELLSQPDPEGADLILNTTSASLQGASLGIPWENASRDAVAYDLMYAEGGTPFLREAAERGLRTCDGRPLLAAQGALAFEWWLGVPAPRQVMLEALD
ncbi:shikimate dehydrogenase family protein [Fimbriimonas ginsengisoli]|uniref:Shikimate dehydrogenase (NADP(+)) n=1 Tax=Fimbriimonas ginsengisoli Gsoil 348 TaxID=661478 RepID=A0A068NNT4_FIMGI|nr:shikimate dehydrogenase [Fimbriimonas ginsengisoli]AIE84420.1 shikimate 5-dehydrogenase [Fimbriimonas ginsengisoli Gsoil 348]